MILVDLRKFREVYSFIFIALLVAVTVYILRGTAVTRVSLPADDIKFKEYTGLNGRFTYKLPAEWRTQEEKFEGNEIIYHNNFFSNEEKLRGFVEVWNLNRPLIEFLNQSKKSAVGIMSFKDYTIEPIKIDGREGYLLKYIQLVDNHKGIKAFEVFIMDGGQRFQRFSFFMDESLWRDEYRDLFLKIAATGKLK